MQRKGRLFRCSFCSRSYRFRVAHDISSVLCPGCGRTIRDESLAANSAATHNESSASFVPEVSAPISAKESGTQIEVAVMAAPVAGVAQDAPVLVSAPMAAPGAMTPAKRNGHHFTQGVPHATLASVETQPETTDADTGDASDVEAPKSGRRPVRHRPFQPSRRLDGVLGTFGILALSVTLLVLAPISVRFFGSGPPAFLVGGAGLAFLVLLASSDRHLNNLKAFVLPVAAMVAFWTVLLGIGGYGYLWYTGKTDEFKQWVKEIAAIRPKASPVVPVEKSAPKTSNVVEPILAINDAKLEVLAPVDGVVPHRFVFRYQFTTGEKDLGARRFRLVIQDDYGRSVEPIKLKPDGEEIERKLTSLGLAGRPITGVCRLWIDENLPDSRAYSGWVWRRVSNVVSLVSLSGVGVDSTVEARAN